ncbi:hypothetical protein B0T24DRAFT_81619 [Lasiosphaeria ovina]|uniref:Uncharacterized protein n=1 Tax=Lasiosphaeria ovina TaxID=92902 RepID=A0AAE0NMM7_9PEZI|nr:hypothetical protein B0T24DRAFT_81619 [Lasiosphaeria ovina]
MHGGRTGIRHTSVAHLIINYLSWAPCVGRQAENRGLNFASGENKMEIPKLLASFGPMIWLGCLCLVALSCVYLLLPYEYCVTPRACGERLPPMTGNPFLKTHTVLCAPGLQCCSKVSRNLSSSHPINRLDNPALGRLIASRMPVPLPWRPTAARWDSGLEPISMHTQHRQNLARVFEGGTRNPTILACKSWVSTPTSRVFCLLRGGV